MTILECDQIKNKKNNGYKKPEITRKTQNCSYKNYKSDLLDKIFVYLRNDMPVMKWVKIGEKRGAIEIVLNEGWFDTIVFSDDYTSILKIPDELIGEAKIKNEYTFNKPPIQYIYKPPAKKKVSKPAANQQKMF